MDSIPAVGAVKNAFYRQLKPIMKEAEINEILGNPQNVRINKAPVQAEIGKQLQNLLAITASSKDRRFNSMDEAKRVLPKELGTLITAYVHLQGKIGNTSFMDEYFSFAKVLSKNIECWNDLLKKAAGSDEFAELQDRFKGFLGVTEEDYDENDYTLKEEVVRERIVLSLAVSCKPWIQIDPNSEIEESLDCTVLLPFKISEDEATAWVERIQSSTSGNVTTRANIKFPGTNENTLNLPSDRIVVFNAEGIEDKRDYAPMDKIQNLSMWERNSTIGDLLKLAEGPREGETALFKFEDNRWIEKDRGFAYVSPIFETEMFKKSLRWHPWEKETSISVEEAQLARAHKALFYAFLGNDVPEDAHVKSVLTKVKCEKPLLSVDSQDFEFNYPPRYWSGTQMVKSERHTSWGRKTIHGINYVVAYLCGKGDLALKADGGNKFLESKDAGKKMCEALNAEAEIFFEKVFAPLGDDDKRQLIVSLYSWMTKQYDKSKGADKEDRPYWEALQNFVDKESEKLGIIIQ